MPSTVSIYNQSKISKQRAIIVTVVLMAHLVLIWALTYLIVPYHVYSPSKNQAITVRLVSTPKSDQKDQTHGALQQAAAQHIVPQDIPKPPVSKAHLAQQSTVQEIIISKQSEKNSTKQTKTEVIKKIDQVPQTMTAQQTKMTTQIEAQNVRSLEHGQGQSEQGQQTSERSDQSNATAEGRSGDVKGQDQSLNQSIPALSEQMKPIPVNRVDVLSFGKLSYNDKDLQQKNRLVILSILIDPTGNPVQVSVKQGSGIDYLDQMVVKAAEKSKFKAHKINGQAVPVMVNFPINLRLNQRRP